MIRYSWPYGPPCVKGGCLSVRREALLAMARGRTGRGGGGAHAQEEPTRSIREQQRPVFAAAERTSSLFAGCAYEPTKVPDVRVLFPSRFSSRVPFAFTTCTRFRRMSHRVQGSECRCHGT